MSGVNFDDIVAAAKPLEIERKPAVINNWPVVNINGQRVGTTTLEVPCPDGIGLTRIFELAEHSSFDQIIDVICGNDPVLARKFKRGLHGQGVETISKVLDTIYKGWGLSVEDPNDIAQ